MGNDTNGNALPVCGLGMEWKRDAPLCGLRNEKRPSVWDLWGYVLWCVAWCAKSSNVQVRLLVVKNLMAPAGGGDRAAAGVRIAYLAEVGNAIGPYRGEHDPAHMHNTVRGTVRRAQQSCASQLSKHRIMQWCTSRAASM
eukprot:1158078-Pelagomonas_calceolata.AAC.5